MMMAMLSHEMDVAACVNTSPTQEKKDLSVVMVSKNLESNVMTATMKTVTPVPISVKIKLPKQDQAYSTYSWPSQLSEEYSRIDIFANILHHDNSSNLQSNLEIFA